jgi:hypothetical protein
MGSNALAALAVKPAPAPVNPLDEAGKALGLQQAIQQIQAGSQENEARQRALDEETAIKQAVQESGGDIRAAMPKIMQVAPTKGAALQKQILEWDNADLDKKKKILGIQSDRSKRLGELAGSATDQASYTTAIDTAKKEGILDDDQYAHLKSTPYDPATVKQFQTQAMTASEQYTAGQKDLDRQDKLAQEAKTSAETQRHNQAMETPAADKELDSFRTEYYGANNITNPTPKQKLAARAAYAAWKKSTTAAAAGEDFTPDALDMAAQMFNKTGQLPALGMGAAAAAARAKILNRAAQVAKENGTSDPATNKAIYTSMSSALKTLTGQQQAIGAYESTAKKNLDLFEQQAKKVIDTGSPWINKPLRAIDRGALGSPDQVAYDTARQVALTEISRVVSNPNLTGVLSDSARHEMEGAMADGATLAQIYKAAGVLRQDMANRKAGNQDQINQLQMNIKGLGTPEGEKVGESGSKPGLGKVLSKAQIQKAATDHKIDYATAKQQAEDQGYKVQE